MTMLVSGFTLFEALDASCATDFTVQNGFILSGSKWPLRSSFAVANQSQCCAACGALPECIGFEYQYLTSVCSLQQQFGPLSGLTTTINAFNVLGVRNGTLANDAAAAASCRPERLPLASQLLLLCSFIRDLRSQLCCCKWAIAKWPRRVFV
jgi:hypothetical protein